MSVLDGFEAVGEKTTTNKMTMTVMESSVRFSKGVTEALGCPAYVKLLVNDKQKKIAVQACDAKDENAIKFCKTKRRCRKGFFRDRACHRCAGSGAEVFHFPAGRRRPDRLFRHGWRVLPG